MTKPVSACLALLFAVLTCAATHAANDWTQLKGDALRSGNAHRLSLQTPLGVVAAIPLSDAVLTSPVVSHGKVFVLDGSGVVSAIDAQTHKILWKFATRGGSGNCNNVAAPAVVGDYLHVGTAAGYYYVLDCESGKVVKEIDCAEPIFSAPAVGEERVYFATLGAKVYAVEPAGEVAWTWDFVTEVVGFDGNRWKGEDWLKFRGDRVTWRDHFSFPRSLKRRWPSTNGRVASSTAWPPATNSTSSSGSPPRSAPRRDNAASKKRSSC